MVNALHTQGLAGRDAAALCTVPRYLTPGSGFPTAVSIGGVLTHAKSARSVLHNRSARRGNVYSQTCADRQFYDAYCSKNLSDSFLQYYWHLTRVFVMATATAWDIRGSNPDTSKTFSFSPEIQGQL